MEDITIKSRSAIKTPYFKNTINVSFIFFHGAYARVNRKERVYRESKTVSNLRAPVYSGTIVVHSLKIVEWDVLHVACSQLPVSPRFIYP